MEKNGEAQESMVKACNFAAMKKEMSRKVYLSMGGVMI
jgi:hypothetical protein